MQEGPKLSQEILVARRALEGLEGFTLLHDWEWNQSMRRWTLGCRLTRDGKINQLVPAETEWYFLVETTYPWGTIKCYPSKRGGLLQTFPHQCYNGCASPDHPWRDGDICLATSVHVLGRHGFDVEPYEPHRRLRWYIQRALDWLMAAAEGNLVQAGDPFELPHFPKLSSAFTTVAFSEDADSFTQWQEIGECCGTLDLLCIRQEPELLLAKCFRSLKNQILVEASWGRLLESTYGKVLKSGIWVRLPGPPILDPWQVPTTWEELRSACQAQRINIDELLKKMLTSIRDGKEHIAIIGFPIPVNVGEKLSYMHWQALQLPILSSGTKTAKGFRTNEAGYWQRDRTEFFNGSAEINWRLSENWHPEQLGTRGKLPVQIISANILLLGAGALGATLAEQLVRAGVRHLTIVDGDRLEAGNLVRHPLGIFDLKGNKATHLAIHLSLASPHASITAIPSSFPNLSSSELALVRQCNVILDCTGQDEVLSQLEAFSWHETKLFVSLSLGFRARRLFCFAVAGSCFPHADFQKWLRPWLEQEIQEYGDERFPREGVGCWHPVFPARIDDVTMMASAAVKHLESTMIAPSSSSMLTIFEQQYEQDLFLGIRKIAPEENDG
jgi:hypothetical protein